MNPGWLQALIQLLVGVEQGHPADMIQQYAKDAREKLDQVQP